MAFNYWKFMASPHGAAPLKTKKRDGKAEKPRLPWFISVTFFVGLLRVAAITLLLLALSIGLDDPMPTWFDALILAHFAALIIVLVFILNGFGWARLAWLILCVAQLWFDQGIITRYVLMFDLVLLLVLVLPASNRYMTSCADARRERND